jgi:DNA repair protein SbcD/Mre11
MMKSYKFAHIADCHVGAWRDEKMRQLNLNTFSETIDTIIAENVDFVLISGDLFNTAVPSIEALKLVTEKLHQLKMADIPVYGIAGSHDYSATGKSMLEVLEKAKLFQNVMKGDVVEGKIKLSFTRDEKTEVKLCGIYGRRGALEKKYYEDLDYESIEKETGEKIFLFHSGIKEFDPENHGESQSLSFLPKGFRYYAGGHVHFRFAKKLEEYGTIVFPGPTCPNNYKEILELKSGSFCIVSVNEEDKKVIVETKTTKFPEVLHVDISGENLSTTKIGEEFTEKTKNASNKLVLVTIKGKLEAGSITDFSKLIVCPEAFSTLRNTSQLKNPEFEKEMTEHRDINEIEKEVISEHIEESTLNDREGKEMLKEKQIEIILASLTRLAQTKLDGETSADFEERIVQEYKKIL